MAAITPDPMFVDRIPELEAFADMFKDVARGRHHHLALLGLRRIGKSALLDEVRSRHPEMAICYLSLDELTASVTDFARGLVAELLRACDPGAGGSVMLAPTDEALRAAAQRLGPAVTSLLEELRAVLLPAAAPGPTLIAAMRFPHALSEALNRPIVVMLDEFQEVARLELFAGTENLLGTIRAALDRRGQVGFVVAGSRVTAMQHLIHDGDSPLFNRFFPLELRPFDLEATHELAGLIWDADVLTHDPDAVSRLHRLAGGWPYPIQVVAQRAFRLARDSTGVVTPDLVDLAIQEELVGRAATLGEHCHYLLASAQRTETERGGNTVLAILRAVALNGPMARARLVRSLRSAHSEASVHRAVNRLLESDFLVEQENTVFLADPLFALWLALEPARRDPQRALADVPARKRLLDWYIQQHAQDRQTMGVLFERRIENLARQFRGQQVPGKWLGSDVDVTLPIVDRVEKVLVSDPEAKYGPSPDTYELDLVVFGARARDVWAIEAKHRRSAITVAMVKRFLASSGAVGKARRLKFAQRWMIGNHGIRRDAKALARSAGVLVSGVRELERLDQLVRSD